MVFTFKFIHLFLLGVFYSSPLLVMLVLVIAALGQLIGRREGWTRSDALYYAFITATTVGYGDIVPRQSRSRLWAIVIALLGVMLTGLIVALGLQAAQAAFSAVNPDALDKLSALS